MGLIVEDNKEFIISLIREISLVGERNLSWKAILQLKAAGPLDF